MARTAAQIAKDLIKSAGKTPEQIEAEKKAAEGTKTPEQIEAEKKAAEGKTPEQIEAEKKAAEGTKTPEQIEAEKKAAAAPPLTEKEIEDLEKGGKTSPGIIQQLRNVSAQLKAFRAALGVNSVDELAGKKLVSEEEITKKEEAFAKTDAEYKRLFFRYHPEFIERFDKPQKQAVANIIQLLKDNEVPEPEKVVANIYNLSGKARLDALGKLFAAPGKDATAGQLTEFSRPDFVMLVRQIDNLRMEAEKNVKLSDEELAKRIQEMDKAREGRSAPQVAALRKGLARQFSNPDNFWLQQSETAGLTGEALTLAKTNNKKALDARLRAEKLLVGNNDPHVLAEVAVKAIGFDEIADALVTLQAELEAKDALIAEAKKKAPEFRAGGSGAGSGARQPAKGGRYRSPMDIAKGLLNR